MGFDYGINLDNRQNNNGYNLSDSAHKHILDRAAALNIDPSKFNSIAELQKAVAEAEENKAASASTYSSENDEFVSTTSGVKMTKEEHEKSETVKSEVDNKYQDYLVAQSAAVDKADISAEQENILDSLKQDLRAGVFDIQSAQSVEFMVSAQLTLDEAIEDAEDTTLKIVNEAEVAGKKVPPVAETNADTESEDDIFNDDKYLANALSIFGAKDEIAA